MKAVVIGPDLNDIEFAVLAIRLRWPDATTMFATTGREGITQVEKSSPDLILLYANLNDRDLPEVIQEVRRSTMAPLLVLGCDHNQMQLVTALSLGADDYVKLPCNITELTVRTWATYRRINLSATGQHEGPLRSGPLLLNLTTREAFLGEQALHLTPTEFRLLRKLVENSGSVLTHRTLENSMWGARMEGQDLVKKYVQRLRHKLGDRAKAPNWIANVHGVGYRFIGPVPTTTKDTAMAMPTEPAAEPVAEIVA